MAMIVSIAYILSVSIGAGYFPAVYIRHVAVGWDSLSDNEHGGVIGNGFKSIEERRETYAW
jgi:hypothetical protein